MFHNMDTHVGKRIRHRRWMNGTTQNQLAETVGISVQQVQEHESGASRVSAFLIREIADALRVPASSFFEGLELYKKTPRSPRQNGS